MRERGEDEYEKESDETQTDEDVIDDLGFPKSPIIFR